MLTSEYSTSSITVQGQRGRTTARVATWETRLHAPTSTTQVPVLEPSEVRTSPAAPVHWFQTFSFFVQLLGPEAALLPEEARTPEAPC